MLDAIEKWRCGLEDKQEFYISIDPGITGAIAVYDHNTNEFIAVHDMPIKKTKPTKQSKSKNKVCGDGLHELFLKYNIVRAILEKVHAMSGQGVTSMFNFGEGFGTIKGVLAAHEIPVKEITPQFWKKKCNLIGADKKASIAEAQIRVPGAMDYLTLKKHDGRADSILMGLVA